MGLRDVEDAFSRYVFDEMPVRMLRLPQMELLDRDALKRLYQPHIDRITEENLQDHPLAFTGTKLSRHKERQDTASEWAGLGKVAKVLRRRQRLWSGACLVRHVLHRQDQQLRAGRVSPMYV